MTPADLIALAERAEKASGAEVEGILADAFAACFPKPEKIWVIDGVEWTPEYGARHERQWAFYGLLEAKGYIDAAMLLVPEGWGWRLWVPNSDSAEPPRVTIWSNGRAYAPTDSTAATPALALTAAALRARAAMERAG